MNLLQISVADVFSMVTGSFALSDRSQRVICQKAPMQSVGLATSNWRRALARLVYQFHHSGVENG
jgi:hypothetical protein